MENNPLLEHDFTGVLPDFDRIEAVHFLPAVQQITESALQKIDAILASNDTPTWDCVFYPVEEALDQLDQAWSVISHLNAVTNTESIREAYTTCVPVVTAFSTRLGQHEKLFQCTEQFSKSSEFTSLPVDRQKTLANSLRDFRLSGIALGEKDRKTYAQIKERLGELATKFANNVLDATQAYTLNVARAEELDGLPPSALDAARELADSKGETGYLFTLDIPSYLPFMQYCGNRELRRQMYQAYVTRASETGPNAGAFDNSELIEEVLQLRQSLAGLLGFANYVEYSLATKMAGSCDEVQEFLLSLAEHSVIPARAEFGELQAFARDELGIEVLQAWDVPYATEQLRERRYALSQEELRPYFPADRVIDGMFDIANKLYGIRVERAEAPTRWHEDVRFYSVTGKHGEPLAQFYLDLFAREGKRGGAWMADCKSRRLLRDRSVQLPVAFLVCNFTPPSADKPSLLTHAEVTTLFHEFGHGLHHMLTRIDAAAVAGINGVPWDAVELPSQFLENWCWEAEALTMISGHYQSGEPLPVAMLEKLLAAKNFQSAMQMVRQLEFALFDIQVHRDYGGENWPGVQAALDAVRERVAAFSVPDYNRFQHSFSHIFAGGYAAGYYSYKWAEVLSADAYSLFEENGIFDSATGGLFYREILARGGSEEPAELFRRFRGRDPSVDALLRHSGIAVKTAA